MKNTLAVLRFEYKGFVSTKSFRVVTIVLVAALLIAASLPQIIGAFRTAGIGGDGSQGSKAALVLSGEALTNDIYMDAFTGDALAGTGAAMWTDLSADPPSDDELAASIADGEYVFAVRYSGGTAFEFFAAGNRITSYGAVASIEALVTDAARRAETAALPEETQEAVARISSIVAEPTVIHIGGDAQNNFWIGYALIMFLFYVIMGYTNYISSSIVTEKTSKAMELLVTAVKPLHLMVGKVLGVGLAALTQVGAIIAAAAVGIAVNLPYWTETGNVLLGLTQGGSVSAHIAIIVIVYFLLGFFLYAFLAAAFASTVTKPEEAATTASLPLLFNLIALMLGFLVLFGVLGKELTAALSYVPFFTSITMMARYTLGDAGTDELLFGAGVLAVSIVVVAILAAKIFRMGVMLYGVKPTPKQVLKALRSP